MLLAIWMSMASAEALFIHSHVHPPPPDTRPRAEVESGSLEDAAFNEPWTHDNRRTAVDDSMIYRIKSRAEESAIRAGSSNPLPRLTPLSDAHFNVPFFVYDEVDWMSTKCDGITISGQENDYHKHSDDFWFLKAALNHGMRTKDPKKARLFVVPALLNLAVEQSVWSRRQCCVGGLCNLDFFQHANDMLNESIWFKRNEGKDHVVVCSHYACLNHLVLFENLVKCNSISFEENSMRQERCRIAGTYVGQRCEHMPKQSMFTLIASMHRRRPNFQSRRDICKWFPHLVSVNQTYNVSICGAGRQCPSLAQARFSPHVRGDTWGSSRLIDIVLSGAVPMFTNTIQYQILPPFVPWESISTQIDVSDRQRFELSVQNSVPLYDGLKQKVDKHAHHLDWETPAPFEQYMWLFQQCIR
ncbi:unnamed protein product [Prorocentrum cordatum]|uniref:Exostosin GT47 domain-containing protein n=1 Tax=Prorocentrum cordatum TaxID=2364126 RepID=A0ABN9U4D8_9DINO|nr:unnamed protein product [Polarella glacialis]CAK0853729.1 unnamed protein product [Polarella glacialis]